jgi:hypothetical protein
LVLVQENQTVPAILNAWFAGEAGDAIMTFVWEMKILWQIDCYFS